LAISELPKLKFVTTMVSSVNAQSQTQNHHHETLVDHHFGFGEHCGSSYCFIVRFGASKRWRLFEERR
jgi:hypothetical protein